MSIFDNANTVTINNKEVKSIVTSNGAVLYRKAEEEYTGVMNYNLTSYNVTCDSTIDANFLTIICVPVPFLEEADEMTGHTLNDLNNVPNVPFDEFSDMISSSGITCPILWSEGSSEYVSDFSELVDGLDIVSLNLETEYESNLFILYSFLSDDNYAWEYPQLKVEYTATNSNNLQAFVTNEIIPLF